MSFSSAISRREGFATGSIAPANMLPTGQSLQPGQVWITTVPKYTAYDFFTVSGTINVQGVATVFTASNVSLEVGVGRFVLSNAVGTVDQSLPPTGTTFGGTTWQTVRRGMQTDGTLALYLTALMLNVAADAVRLIRVGKMDNRSRFCLNLKSLTLENNPLNNTVQNFIVGSSEIQPINNVQIPELSYTVNSSAPVIQPIGPIALTSGSNKFIHIYSEDPDNPSNITIAPSAIDSIQFANSATGSLFQSVF
ncbi:MAG: hypothetical protein U0930_11150 [Pirellulales bacterium]